MSARHTPGPWFVNWEITDQNPHGHYGEGHQAVCAPDSESRSGSVILCWTTRGDKETSHANARLMAAAPDLAEALAALQQQLHEHIKLDVRKHFSLMVADAAAGKALAKAGVL